MLIPLDTFFRQIKSFIRFRLAFVFGVQSGNWPKKSNALALEIVSLKCNALVIMH